MAVLDSLWNAIAYKPPVIGGEDEDGNEIGDLNLKYNYFPNPVRDILYLEYYFEANAAVTIYLYDMNGIPVRIIPKGMLPKGFYREEINCTALPPGNYVLMLNAGSEVVSGVVSKR
jgi:hypothetical protein